MSREAFPEDSNQARIEFTNGETLIAVPIYLCEECTEELEDDIFEEQNIAAQIKNLQSEGFEIRLSGICSRELFAEIELHISDQVKWCHGGHEGGFGDDIVSGPEDTERWDKVWERMKHVYEDIYDEMARWRKEDPDK